MTGSTSSRLSYLDKMGLVCPQKIGQAPGKKPAVFYTDKQIEQIRLIDKASQFFHAEGIRTLIEKDCLSKALDALLGAIVDTP